MRRFVTICCAATAGACTLVLLLQSLDDLTISQWAGHVFDKEADEQCLREFEDREIWAAVPQLPRSSTPCPSCAEEYLRLMALADYECGANTTASRTNDNVIHVLTQRSLNDNGTAWYRKTGEDGNWLDMIWLPYTAYVMGETNKWSQLMVHEAAQEARVVPPDPVEAEMRVSMTTSRAERTGRGTHKTTLRAVALSSANASAPALQGALESVGWGSSVRVSPESWNASGCGRLDVIDEPVLLVPFGSGGTVDYLGNAGRFIVERLLWPMVFFELQAPAATKALVFPNKGYEAGLRAMAAGGGDAFARLARETWRPRVASSDFCLRRAVVGTGAYDRIWQYRHVRRRLELALQLDLRPLQAGVQKRLAFLLRQPGSSRYLENVDALAAAARNRGYEVLVPLQNGTMLVRPGKFLDVVRELQSVHVIVAVYGAELSVLPFCRSNTVAIQITSYDYGVDYWSIRSARWARTHLLRWYLKRDHFTYASEVPPRCPCDSRPTRCKRSAHNVTAPLNEWTQLLDVSYRFIRSARGLGPSGDLTT
ncbi:hypothetical protein DIPPA_27955 [Diplonema papillatum]|nr:hypothetical protein DIPPA_27955 [Diplonema papillatum]|eukprot:gene9570-14852_t